MKLIRHYDDRRNCYEVRNMNDVPQGFFETYEQACDFIERRGCVRFEI